MLTQIKAQKLLPRDHLTRFLEAFLYVIYAMLRWLPLLCSFGRSEKPNIAHKDFADNSFSPRKRLKKTLWQTSHRRRATCENCGNVFLIVAS